MCMGSPCTPANFQWPGEGIYIAHQVELTVCSHCPLFRVGIGSSGDEASVQPVTLRLKLSIGFSDTSVAEPITEG